MLRTLAASLDDGAHEDCEKAYTMNPLIRISTAALLALVTSAAAVPAQERSGAKPPAKGDSVVVTGCLVGPRLQALETSKADDTGRLTTAITYQLKGEKGLLKRLRGEHDGK